MIQNGIDLNRIEDARNRFNRTEFCRRWDLPADSSLVGSIGTFTRLKGHEDFLQAAATFQKPFRLLRYFGTESPATKAYRRRLESLIQQLNLTDRVRLIGRMDDISELHCALDIFVSASHSESFGLAIVEAMAAGTAVVATETEGAQEIIEDGKSGILVPIGAAQTMADAIGQLLHERKRRHEMADNGRARVRERFSLERMVMRQGSYAQSLSDR